MHTLYADSQSNTYKLIKVINSFEKDRIKAEGDTLVSTYITNLISQTEDEFKAQAPNSTNLTISYHYYHQIVVEDVAQIPIWQPGIPSTENVFSVDNIDLITIIEAFAPMPSPAPASTTTQSPA